MTVWFGVGLIVYLHLAILLVGLICSAETRKLRIRVKDLETKSEKTARSLSNAVNNGECQADQDTGAPQSHAPPNLVADSSATRSKVGELAAQGLSREEISRLTGTPRAEVDLLLKLRQLQSPKAKSAAS